jgi:hypothetical protein
MVCGSDYVFSVSHTVGSREPQVFLNHAIFDTRFSSFSSNWTVEDVIDHLRCQFWPPKFRS